MTLRRSTIRRSSRSSTGRLSSFIFHVEFAHKPVSLIELIVRRVRWEVRASLARRVDARRASSHLGALALAVAVARGKAPSSSQRHVDKVEDAGDDEADDERSEYDGNDGYAVVVFGRVSGDDFVKLAVDLVEHLRLDRAAGCHDGESGRPSFAVGISVAVFDVL
jgi:hypothetical protein